ncbi:3-hydroxy-9,10-secoandrosta-1,3,5(10)-triene-9,17-dione monooxygenase reductase subunit [Amycolatopsis decaplanina]|uniref:Flavin reductase domain-containing protein n=1 Tax=Amycolatopsis decaplanina DSM 44594 TaxID=1284240 RepID=M2XY92_9PSEU|nr:3-hydroxy-9,10-secoandrosta-1,3,5(10)-triene-9,17-dione monooxygenase reductase subunit [Amycolatopsis decaplanina]EME54120.1 flavin reductase domain-containing protein [Amycolatopsis decaplanina DSM 44594]
MTPVTDLGSDIDPARFRTVLGHFCTGVAVVTGHDGRAPVGFACQSFAALSLDPPLVLFCPAKTSRTWAVLAESGRFAVNVLSEDQQDVSAVFGSRGADKFASIDWTPAPSGSPLLTGALTWIDCTLEAVHEAGDHYVVVGRVTALGEPSDDRPLLFHRGRYTVTEPVTDALAALMPWPRPDDWL